MAEPKLKIRKVKHANFHLGVQFEAKVYSSLNSTKHAGHDLEMHAMPNNRLHVRMGKDEWLVPDAVIHSMKLEPEKE